jgi:chromosome segregation ATPase
VQADKTEEEIAAEREEELSALGATLAELTDAVARLVSQRELLLATLPRMRAELDCAKDEAAELEKRYLVRKNCLDLLPEADANIAQLTSDVAALGMKMLALAQEWEQVRMPLVAAIDDEHAHAGARVQAASQLVESITTLRADMSGLGVAVVQKDEDIRRLGAELETMHAQADVRGGAAPGVEPIVLRPTYTKRIMDIIRQIRKQKSEIGRIVKDVRNVQQDISVVGDKLRRTITVANELMEKGAAENAKDAAYRQVFRSVVSVQELFDKLIAVTASASAAENEARDLENRLEQLALRKDAANLAQLKADLVQLQHENATLAAQLN